MYRLWDGVKIIVIRYNIKEYVVFSFKRIKGIISLLFYGV